MTGYSLRSCWAFGITNHPSRPCSWTCFTCSLDTSENSGQMLNGRNPSLGRVSAVLMSQEEGRGSLAERPCLQFQRIRLYQNLEFLTYSLELKILPWSQRKFKNVPHTTVVTEETQWYLKQKWSLHSLRGDHTWVKMLRFLLSKAHWPCFSCPLNQTLH